MKTSAWWSFRRLRRAAFSITGRNPLARGRHWLGRSEEWQSVRGLVQALRIRPAVIRRDETRLTWLTSMCEIVTPLGAGADYIGRLTAEMPSSVYVLSKNDRVVIDAGANIGLFSLHALRSGAERVVAFEPSPGNARCLRTNLRQYIEESRVIAIEKGVWSEAKTLRFSTVNVNNPGGHHIAEDGEMEVPVTSIDQAVKELGLNRVDYIKMDVEGSELRAIEGARETIVRFRPRMCIATEHTDDLYANAQAVISAMSKYGYDYVCTEVHPYRSPSVGLMLTPYCLLFTSAHSQSKTAGGDSTRMPQ